MVSWIIENGAPAVGNNCAAAPASAVMMDNDASRPRTTSMILCH